MTNKYKPEFLEQNGKEIVLDASHITYEDLQGIERFLEYGIIVESGSDENSYYIKYGDGTMICGGQIALSSGSIEIGEINIIRATYPEPFVSEPIISDSHRFSVPAINSIQNYHISTEDPKNDYVDFNIAHFGISNGRVSVRIRYIAIGRWK